jgi:hypothetical protein
VRNVLSQFGAVEVILGIDIGVQGAVAILDQSGALVEIHDMPTLQGGPAGRRAVNAPLLASIVFKSHATAAFVESVNARPEEGPTGAFAFGRARGRYRRRSRRRWNPYHVHNAACVEAGRRLDAQIKGRGTIGSHKALA